MTEPEDIARIREAQADFFRGAAAAAEAGKHSARALGFHSEIVNAWARLADWWRGRAEEAEK